MRGGLGGRPSWSAFVLLAMLVVPVAFVLLAQPSQAATTRTLTISTASARPTVPFGNFDGNPPKVFDFDGDGDLEIVAQNDNQWVYVFDSRTGAILAQLKTVFPSGWGARTMNGPEVAIMSGDGKVHLVVMNSAATLTSYTFDAVGSTSTHFAFKKDWQRRLTDCYSNPGSDSKPTLADLDKDGRLDIIATTEESGVYAVRMDGSLLWKKCIGGGNADAAVADLNRDGWPDVVFGSDGSVVTAINGRTGATLWSFWALGRYDLRSGSIPVGPGIGQLDGVGGPDVVVGLRDSHDTSNHENDHAMLLALDSGGRVLWAKQDAVGNPLTYTHPIIVDADRDGTNEVYWADWNTIGHKGGIPDADAWKTTGPAKFYRYDNWGNLVWRQSLATFWNNKDIALADADGDGAQEVLANGPGSNGHDGIWYLNSNTGAQEAWVDLHPWKLSRGVIVADLYGDGRMQWVAQVGAASSTVSGGGILVYSTGVAYNSAWPHLPYPRAGTGTSTATGTPGDFQATFTVPSGVNEWWVEVAVDGSQPVNAVCAQVNGGACTGLSPTSWGTWAKSLHVAAGAQVVFKATSSTGAVATSTPFTWLSGSSTGTSTPTATSSASATSTTGTGSFDAAFSVPSGVNEWWVEVRVDANKPVASVCAQVNGGTCTALAKQSWGNWAKSFHVPAGASVVFRATSGDGDAAASPTVRWLSGATSFAANFTPKAVGNDWWVEVDVGATKALAGVDARVNGGPWTALAKQSWGSWAKSLNAPNGSTVTFRATSVDGEAVTSRGYAWP